MGTGNLLEAGAVIVRPIPMAEYERKSGGDRDSKVSVMAQALIEVLSDGARP
ncbi:hypothetical protein [Streptomyces sp. NBC_00576]|uniref:hypothetical protein n=1 Tax=Streptomyces sp. NBC_00576 TaxID=2903665 RepID=UPI002E806745|nr:hypothetical protein [Streptomyces sp. NBC_00576]WUB73006.1 hypothetical protein OG734_24570 [Streptomyces sp. NBC_00576]